jgi:hypothetical protein
VRKTHLMVLAAVAVAIVLAIGAVSAYADISSDSEKPATTTNAAESYWDVASFTITATDNEGVAYIYTKLDDHVVRLDTVSDKPASVELAFPTEKDGTISAGQHTLKYWAQDINGNVESPNSVTFTVVKDTVAPVTSAHSASVRRGRTVTLKYQVSDPEPTKGTADVRIVIKNAKHKTVKKIDKASAAVNVSLSAKFRCKLAKGAYKYYVYATDASGNAQSKIGSAKLTVK